MIYEKAATAANKNFRKIVTYILLRAPEQHEITSRSALLP